MLSKIWNLLIVVGLGAAAYAYVTGRDLNGVPTSTANMDCDVLVKHFVGQQMEMNYSLRKVQRIDPLETIQHDDQTFMCLGRAYLEGTPATYVRLSSNERSAGNFDLLIEQAHPSDYNCDRLADEIVMKFSGQTVADVGVLMEIGDTKTEANKPPLHCRGMARFTNGLTWPVSYSYDGEEFWVSP